MTDIREALARINARAEKATPGPWEPQKGFYGHEVVVDEPTPGEIIVANGLGQGYDEGEHDADFIAWARADVPRLAEALEAVLALTERREGAGALVAPDLIRNKIEAALNEEEEA